MRDFTILKDLLTILAVTLPVTFIFHKFRLPTIMGYIITGLLIGPYGIGLITETGEINILAEIGVVLLLFTVGLEFSLAGIMKNLKRVLGGGALQVVLTIAGTVIIARAYNLDYSTSLFYGFLVALSSTAIVLKMSTDMGSINAPSGKFIVGALLFQDICVVPMMLLIPILGKASGTSPFEIAWILFKAVSAILIIFFAARLLVPMLLSQIVKLKNRESLILFVVLICLGAALLTQSFGLSLAMGAFIAGLIISESDYSHQIVVDILPFRDFFSSIFFISIGMLLQIKFFISNIETILILTGVIVLLKALVAFFSAYIIERLFRLSFIAGLCLAQIGEFSFLIAELGVMEGLMNDSTFQIFLGCAILSMFAAPLMIQSSHEVSHWITSFFPGSDQKYEVAEQQMEGHVIIAGYGINGKNLAKVLLETDIPYIVVDLNSENVAQAKTSKIPVIFGDITRKDILRKAGIKKAKVIVFAISDPISVRRALPMTREENKDVFVLVRTRYSSEVDALRRLKADQVIPMEFETSIEIFSRVLKEYNIPSNIISQHIEMIRTEGYGMLRGLSLTGDRLQEFYQYLSKTTTVNYLVMEKSPAIGKTIKEIDLRNKTGTMILTIIRGQEPFSNPDSNFQIAAGDLLILMGSHVQLEKAKRIFSPED